MQQNRTWNRLTSDITDVISQPLIEISGNRRVLIEHHKGIAKYDRDSIEIKVDYGAVRIDGIDLVLAQISRQQLVITGKIAAVLLFGGDNDFQA